MSKTIKFNNRALFNLQTLNGLIMSTWNMHYNESEEKIEDAFQRGIIDFNHVKNRYDTVFNMKNGPFDYDINYEKNLLSKLNKEFKKWGLINYHGLWKLIQALLKKNLMNLW